MMQYSPFSIRVLNQTTVNKTKENCLAFPAREEGV